MDGCLSITKNDDVIDILLTENENNSEKKGEQRGRLLSEVYKYPVRIFAIFRNLWRNL